MELTHLTPEKTQVIIGNRLFYKRGYTTSIAKADSSFSCFFRSAYHVTPTFFLAPCLIYSSKTGRVVAVASSSPEVIPKI